MGGSTPICCNRVNSKLLLTRDHADGGELEAGKTDFNGAKGKHGKANQEEHKTPPAVARGDGKPENRLWNAIPEGGPGSAHRLLIPKRRRAARTGACLG